MICHPRPVRTCSERRMIGISPYREHRIDRRTILLHSMKEFS
jgi:hypothetical protein